MKLILLRNGTWYSGLCVDQIEIKTDGEKDIEQLHQQIYTFKELGYEIEDHCNNPFMKTEQFEYRNENDDRVIVRIDWKDKSVLKVLKQYNNIENCETTAEVITRLGALNKIFDDVVKVFRDRYGIREEHPELMKGEKE